MRRAIWWVAIAAYACWVLSPWGWVDLVSLIGLALGWMVTYSAVSPEKWNSSDGRDRAPTLTERFWGTVVAAFLAWAFGWGLYAVSTPRGKVAMVAGIVAAALLTTGHYAAREATEGRD